LLTGDATQGQGSEAGSKPDPKPLQPSGTTWVLVGESRGIIRKWVWVVVRVMGCVNGG